MPHQRVNDAQAELSAIEARCFADAVGLDMLSVDPRRHNVVFSDGHKVGLIAHLNRRRKAMRDWVRKWGKELRALGYEVVQVREETFPSPTFAIREAEVQSDDDDDATAQLEKEKSRNFFDPKRARSKRLRMTDTD